MNQDKTRGASLPKTRETIAIAVAERYQADETFRNSFDRDPKATILQAFDIAQEHWPAGMELTILRNDDRHVHVAIPIPASSSDAEMSDPDLDDISGGWINPANPPPAPTAQGIWDLHQFLMTGRMP